MPMFEVYATFLRHDGGSKFYEAVLIHDKAGPAMLIKRWGKTGQDAAGTGQTMVTRGTFDSQRAEYDSILAEKHRWRAGKGQYLDDSALSKHGYHTISLAAGVTEASTKQVRDNLDHYVDSEVQSAIEVHFGLGDVDDIVAATGEDVVIEGEIEINEPEPDRGTGWASW
jgi:predicted DNA-binding WGR domain protein